MSLGTSLTLSKDCATDVDTSATTMTLRAADIGKSIFSESGLTLPIENLFTVSHDVGKAGNQRHLVRRDLTLVDSLGVPGTSSVYIVIDRAAHASFTVAQMKQMVNELVDFLIEGGSNANVAAILNNEV